jgi:pilus assembly protein Flp/PilA
MLFNLNVPGRDRMLHFFRDRAGQRKDDGASAVEYGLLVAGIAALIVVIVFALGGVVRNTFSDTCNTIKQGSSTTAASC